MKKFSLLLLSLFAVLSAWADDVDLAEDQNEAEGTAARWFVTVPAGTQENSLTLSDASISTFKVYDDGGKDGNYSNGCRSKLIITAPAGYVIQLSGRIKTERSYDKLTVYDGNGTSSPKLINEANGNSSEWMAINTVISTGQSMTLYFYSDSSSAYEGFDLTVDIVDPTEKRAITVKPAEHGSMESNKTEALIEEVITLTATPDDDYVLSGLSVKDPNGNDVTVDWVTYLNTATFTMPASAVIVTPTFTESTNDAPFINMPTAGTKTITIPEGLMSLKVYDNGGKDGNLIPECSGYLVLTAPEGYNLKVSGTITAGGTNTSDQVTVFDGIDKTAPKLIDYAQSSSWYRTTDIPTATSTGQSIMIWFTGYWTGCKGLDLTVDLVSTSTEYDITVNNPDEGGTVTSDVDAAVVNQTVTLTASPDEDFVVTDLVVTDANNNLLAVTDMKWYTGTNTATFTMPASAVAVTPSFSNDLTSLFIDMPKTGTKNAIIPANIASFKVYDNGGSDGDYTFSCDGTLVITVPEGYKIQLTGNIMTSQDDYFTVYDNNEASGTKLLDRAVSEDYYEWSPISVTSTGESMTLYFYSDDSAGNTDGLDLTVTLVPDTYAINLPESFEHGTVTCDKESAAVGEIVTLTVEPDNGYELKSLTVTTAGGDEPSDAPIHLLSSSTVELTPGEEPNTYKFEMPAAPVTVEATFKKAVPTGVENINVTKSKTGQRYNLNGQPVGKDYKGIVIEDGQKLIVR